MFVVIKRGWWFVWCWAFALPAEAQVFMTRDSADQFTPTQSRQILDAEDCSDSFWSYSVIIYYAFTHHQNDSLYGYAKHSIPQFDPSRTGLYRHGYGESYWGNQYVGNFSDDAIEGLASGLDSIVYAAGVGLSTYNPATGAFGYVGDFPPEMRCGGGMTLREGKIYFTTIRNSLVEVNTADPMASVQLHTFPDSIAPINSLVTIPFRCDSIVTYAFAGRYGEPNVVYILDFDDFSLTPICSKDKYYKAAAHYKELQVPPCELAVDLGGVSGDMPSGSDYASVAVCATPLPVGSDELRVYAPIGIDSITLHLSGILDPGWEYLSGISVGAVAVNGSGTTSLTLTNTGSASLLDFELALRSVRFLHDLPEPALGQRQVEVVAYASHYRSLPSYAYLNLDRRLIRLDAEVSLPCNAQSDGEALLEGQGGTAPYGFLWPDGYEGQQRAGLSSGAYPILITDGAGCQNIDTLYLGQHDSLWLVIASDSDFICGDYGLLSAAVQGGEPPYLYAWNGQLGSDTLSGIGPGEYVLSVVDANGCAAYAAYTLGGADTIFALSQIILCSGDTYEWQGQDYTADTMLCEVYVSALGCDSIHCVSLIFAEPYYQEVSYSLCQGEELFWEGLVLSADTSFCLVYSDSNGCDSTLCVQLEIIKRSSFQEAAICQGEHFLFGGRALRAPGLYADTLSMPGGCDSLSLLRLEVLPLPMVEIGASGNLCAAASVRLSVEVSGQYAWSTGAIGSEIEVSQPGIYSLTVTDADGCQASDTIILSEEVVEASFQLQHPRCHGEANGRIVIDSIWGGLAPYLYSFEGGPLQSVLEQNDLPGGNYSILIEDAQGCRREFGLLLEPPSPLFLALPANARISLGDSLMIAATTNAVAPAISWHPPDFLDCATCLSPVARPLRTITYEVSLTDSLGCAVAGSVTLYVHQGNSLYVPNAFSPNGDGINDHLVVYADASVEELLYLRIFDRWGSLVFERRSFAPNEETQGWDGTIGGRSAPAGIYLCHVLFRRIDGVEESVIAEIALLR